MLKLPKGLKKKKKGKKSKKDKELFTEEELEQYKLQQQQKQQQQLEQQIQEAEQTGEASASDTETAKGPSTSDAKNPEADEEWLKFKALTAGVDSILHKTQDDLDRIKSTSFFQRVPPPSEQKKKEEEEAARREAERLEEERRRKEEEEANRDVLAEAVVELSESEEESEEVDDIFDTGYIEAITSGEVQFAVVPDSPEFEVDEGPDPFDTSYADKLIKGPEVSKRGKKLVSIGAAVEVLTGRVESVQPSGSIKRKPRRGPQDLLLDAFDDESATPPTDADVSVTPEPPKTLLDELEDDVPAELPPIDLSVSLHLTLQKQAEEKAASAEVEKVDVVSEFDVLKDDEDDEFAELAVESLTKKEEVTVVTQVQPLEYTGAVASDWAEFEVQQEETVEQVAVKSKPPRPPPASIPAVTNAAESDDEFDIPEDDPFDTTFVEKVIPVKEDDDFDFDPRAEEKKEASELKVERDLLGGSNSDLTSSSRAETTTLNVVHRDLLGGSNTDLSAVGLPPINPLSKELDDKENEDFDPFDTSAVTRLVQPKETELKFLEKELLAESKLKHSVSDPDFDPRAGEEPSTHVIPAVTPTDQLEQARRKSSLHLNIQPKSVGFLVPEPDLLSIDHESGKIHKPLTPYYTKEPSIIETETKEQEDPFDTSFVPDSKPTQVELNLIERDLLASTNLKHSLSDPDFDPRAEESVEGPAVPEVKSNLLAVENQIDIKVLTPAAENNKGGPELGATSPEFVDPFDTSSVELTILPGKTELKLIESELLTARAPETVTGVLDTLTDAQELGLGDKVLTPQAPPVVASASTEEVDPFDTSFAENLGPGRAEIKVLETELIQN